MAFVEEQLLTGTSLVSPDRWLRSHLLILVSTKFKFRLTPRKVFYRTKSYLKKLFKAITKRTLCSSDCAFKFLNPSILKQFLVEGNYFFLPSCCPGKDTNWWLSVVTVSVTFWVTGHYLEVELSVEPTGFSFGECEHTFSMRLMSPCSTHYTEQRFEVQEQICPVTGWQLGSISYKLIGRWQHLSRVKDKLFLSMEIFSLYLNFDLL